MNTAAQISSRRQEPIAVLRQKAAAPLVCEGGPRINSSELREDFFDADANGWRRAGVYPLAMCQGEPFASWY